MSKASFTITDFYEKLAHIISTPVFILHGYRFSCEIELTSEKILHFYFHPLIRTFEFDFVVNIKNPADDSVADSVSEHITVDLDLTNSFEFSFKNPFDDSWIKQSDKSVTLEFEIIPTEADYSPQLDYIFEVLYSQLSGEDGFDETVIQWILGVAERIFLEDSTLLRTNSPCVIVGDLHGQLYDLMRIFKKEGTPDDGKTFIFLGDYVDRGYDSLSTFLLLLAYKIKYPKQCLIIRGNHECEDISSRYGFRDEILVKFGATVFNDFIPVFDAIPIAVLIDDKIFCVHGGLSPDLQLLSDIENIKRPFTPKSGEMSYDLLWSDPSADIEGYGPSPRGSSFVFGKNEVLEFMSKNNLSLFIRAHQMMINGYGYNFGEDVPFLTIFSASNYTTDKNNGGYATLNEKDEIELHNYDKLTQEQLEQFKETNLIEYLKE